MTFAALCTLRRLEQRRDVAVLTVEHDAAGGARVLLLHVARPVQPATRPVPYRISPQGVLECAMLECERAAA